MEITLKLTEAQAEYIRGAIISKNLRTLGRYDACYKAGNIKGAKEALDEHDSGREVVEMIDAFLRPDLP